MTARTSGVTFVIPVLNGRRYLRSVIDAVLAQDFAGPLEILIVDDGSSDGSGRLLRAWESAGTVTVLRGPGRGAAAAINTGIREARYPVVCQIDQDVILRAGWLATLLAALDDPGVAAAQGQYVTAPDAGFWARAMGRDLEQRYARIRSTSVNHVCTGNTAYRLSALHGVGLLDERLGYGYDNDLSYRLGAHGHRLAFCRDAISVHRWREGPGAYLRQQFGVGYGRLDVVARHPRRMRGDDVSGWLMMAHAPAMLAGLAAAGAAAIAAMSGADWFWYAAAAAAIVGTLALERSAAGIAAWRQTGDAAALGFAGAHLARDCAWAVAIAVWTGRRLLRRDGDPVHSMRRRRRSSADRRGARTSLTALEPGALLAIVPALNEEASLARVVSELRRVVPQADVLIVNDGSTDATAELLPRLGVRWLTMSQRVGVGGAVRAGIQYGVRQGYRYVVRVDGDGQHRAGDIAQLLEAVTSGHSDAAIGSRFLGRSPRRHGLLRASQASLAACLTLLTRQRVTDPTSGSWLFGPRALRLLGRHHPGGYGEPELLLLLRRNRLRVIEVPIRVRPRLGGQTSLTPSRAALALARTLLAMLVVPLRRIVEGQPGD